MKLTFREVTFKNFLSAGMLPIVVRLDGTPLTMICGENGSGKSAVIDAIVFALYGRPFRDDVVKDGLVNWLNGEGAEVTLSLDINDVPFLVRRTIDPNKFDVYRDGKPVDLPKNATQAQKMFETDILRVNEKALTQIVILGKAGYVPFMKLTAAQRRTVVEEIIDISVFSRMAETLKPMVTKAKADRTEAQTLVRVAEGKLAALEEQDRKASVNHDVDIERVKGEIAGIEARLKALVVPPEPDKKEAERVNVALKDLQRKKGALEGIISSIDRQLQKFDSPDCPVCGQPISADHKTREIEKLTKEREAAAASIKAADEQIAELNGKLPAFFEQDKAHRRAKGEQESLGWQIEGLNKQLKQLASVTAAARPDKAPVVRELDAAKAKFNKIEEVFDLLAAANRLLKDDGIKASVVRRYLPALNAGVNQHVRRFGLPLTFQFNETFDETVRARYVHDTRFGNLSEGQKLRVELSLLMCWRDIARQRASIDTNLLFFDEILDASLDQAGCAQLVQFLKELNANVFVISHRQDDEIADAFTRILKFEMKSDFSSVSEITR